MFYIKTDLDVAGPFTGIEVREASLAGIVRFNTFLSGTPDGPWIAAVDVGLFSDTHFPLPHPPGTDVPTYQTRGMPGAFMGPFKLRELIGFACQGMLPPGTELQSDPSRPWIPITGTGILPACLRGDLVRILPDRKLLLRTVVPTDLDLRRQKLETLQSPIELAQQISASGATTKPLERRVGLKSDRLGDSDSAEQLTEQPVATRHASQRIADSGTSRQTDTGTESNVKNTDSRVPVRRGGVFARTIRLASNTMSSAGRLVSTPKAAVAVALLLVGTIGLPLAYSSWTRSALSRRSVLGEWVRITDPANQTTTPNIGVGLAENGTCVLTNSSGASWTGDFKWANRIDEKSGFNPSNQVAITYDTATPNHQESLVVPSDGYLRLVGFVKDPPQLDGHPVRELFVRRAEDQLWLGYRTKAQWVDGQRQLTAAWVVFDEAKPPSQSIIDLLGGLPEESLTKAAEKNDTQSLCHAIEAATKGREFEYKGRKQFRNACFVDSKTVDAAYLLQHAGVPDEARPLLKFEIQPSYGGPSMEDAQLLRYGHVKFFANPDGKLLFLELDKRSANEV